MKNKGNEKNKKQKTITFLFMYYYPEVPTISYIYQPLVESYITKGNKVNIITPNPTRGISKEEVIKYKHNDVEMINENLTVYRVKCFTYKNYSKLNLLHRYMSISRRCSRKLKQIETDEVFLQTSPPIFYAYWGSKVAKKKETHVIYNIQDIYPDNIRKPKSLFYKIINHFQKKTMQNSDRIVTISKDMKETLLKKGDFKDKIEIIPNGLTYEVETYKKSKIIEIRKRYNLNENYLNIIYAGNIGYLQDLDILIAAAKLLLNEEKIKFTIIGEGSQSNRIKQRVIDEKVSNVSFFPMGKMEDSPYIYKLADVNFISLVSGVIYTACPLKTAMIINADKQIIAAVDEDSHYANELKEKYNAIIIPNRDYNKLANVLITLAKIKIHKKDIKK